MSEFRRSAICLGIAVLLLAACGTAPQPTLTSTSSPSPASRFPTSEVVVRRTLPPTWTPTATATATDTPTITPTSTITPTPSIDEICEEVTISFSVLDGWTYETSDRVPFLFSTNSRMIGLELLIVQQDSGEEFRMELPGGEGFVGVFPLDVLPEPGPYRWKASATTPEHPEICTQTGTFNLETQSRLDAFLDTLATVGAYLRATPTPPPEAEVTAEATTEP